MNEAKICTKCKKEFPLSEFYGTVDIRNGKEKIYSRCVKCTLEDRSEEYQKKFAKTGRKNKKSSETQPESPQDMHPYDALMELLPLKDDLTAMLAEFKSGTNKQDINIDSTLLTGKVVPKTFKMYENVIIQFTEFSKQHKQNKLQNTYKHGFLGIHRTAQITESLKTVSTIQALRFFYLCSDLGVDLFTER